MRFVLVGSEPRICAVDGRHALDLLGDDAIGALLDGAAVAPHPERGEALRLEEERVDQAPLVGHALEHVAGVDDSKPRDRGDAVQPFGHAQRAGERVGQAGGDAGDRELLEFEVVGELAQIGGPIEDGASGQRIGVTESRPLGCDQADARAGGAVGHDGGGDAGGGQSVVEEDRFAGGIAVLGPAQGSAVGQPDQTMWRFGIVVGGAAGDLGGCHVVGSYHSQRGGSGEPPSVSTRHLPQSERGPEGTGFGASRLGWVRRRGVRLRRRRRGFR